MVMVFTSTPDASSESLRGSVDLPTDVEDLKFDYNTIVFKICRFAMSECSERIRADKVCQIDGKCGFFHKEIGIPLSHSLCGFASEQCDSPEMEELLRKLYNAGAISQSPAQTKEIDDKISELNKLRHELRIVTTASNAEKAKKAREQYLKDREESHKTFELEPSQKIKEKESLQNESTKIVESEEVVV